MSDNQPLFYEFRYFKEFHFLNFEKDVYSLGYQSLAMY